MLKGCCRVLKESSMGGTGFLWFFGGFTVRLQSSYIGVTCELHGYYKVGTYIILPSSFLELSGY